MPDCPYCNEEIHVESEDIRDVFDYWCGHCDKKVVIELDWSLHARKPDPDHNEQDPEVLEK